MDRCLSWLLLAVMGFAGCGPSETPQVPPVNCPLIAGSFTANYTLVGTEGSCGAAKATSTDPMRFEAGRYLSPVDGLIWCATTQNDCDVLVRCTTLIVAARLDFEGTLSADGTQLVGTATLQGSFRGCNRVSYGVDALMNGASRPGEEEALDQQE